MKDINDSPTIPLRDWGRVDEGIILTRRDVTQYSSCTQFLYTSFSTSIGSQAELGCPPSPYRLK
jgi:hypothetical protein